MKKGNLLASTALVSAALAMGATSAHALSLKLGGFAEFWAGYGDQESFAPVRNNFDLKTDAEIHFRAEDKLDNGMTVGVLFEMEAGNGNDNGSGPAPAGTATDGFDESFAWVKTKWGQINVGNNDVASAYIGGPSVVGPVGLTKSDAGDWINGVGTPNNTDVDLGMGDAQNVTYFTPRVAGFQAIFSYTPDNSDFTDSDFDNNASTGFHNGLSSAIKFSRKFGKVGVGINAGYTTLEASDFGAGTTRGDRGPDTAEGYGIGTKIDFSGFRLSGNYARENLTNRVDRWYAVALRYKVNKMHTVSIGYSNGERSHGATQDNDWFTAGWEADMGKGVKLAASVFRVKTDNATPTSDVDAWGVVGGLKLAF